MRTAKVAISLPLEILALVEEARQPGQSRSEFIAHALRTYLADKRAREEAEAYARGYELFPETAKEIEEAHQLGIAALAREPWD
jgi:metal-responsive CopG/Arc/MetJ family transcriptional regulator